jgi:hypothetical protein
MVLKTKTKEKNLKMKGIKMNYLKNKDYWIINKIMNLIHSLYNNKMKVTKIFMN